MLHNRGRGHDQVRAGVREGAGQERHRQSGRRGGRSALEHLRLLCQRTQRQGRSAHFLHFPELELGRFGKQEEREKKQQSLELFADEVLELDQSEWERVWVQLGHQLEQLGVQRRQQQETSFCYCKNLE